jgi:hypothetical protein
MEEAMFGYKDILGPLIANGGDTKDIKEALIQAGLSKKKAGDWAKSKSLYEVFPKPTNK